MNGRNPEVYAYVLYDGSWSFYGLGPVFTERMMHDADLVITKEPDGTLKIRKDRYAMYDKTVTEEEALDLCLSYLAHLYTGAEIGVRHA